jgi:adenine phosphoribosyltransferase
MADAAIVDDVIGRVVASGCLPFVNVMGLSLCPRNWLPGCSMLKEYQVNIGGLERRYPIVRLSEDVHGVYFFMPGDVELIEHCGRLIADSIGTSCDYLVVPEVGGIPLAHNVALRLGLNYLVVRKSVKRYMENPMMEDIASISTPGTQKLVIDGRDIGNIREKRIALIDDVISSLGTLRGLFKLANRCSSQVTYVASVFLEGETTEGQVEAEFGCPLISLGHLPLIPASIGVGKC